MTPSLPRVYNIAPGGDFLDVLANNILNGFPHDAESLRVPLSRWIIILPTRRAVKQLGQTLLRASGRKAILLPHIRPIGDLDDELATNVNEQSGLPKAISPSGQFLDRKSVV